MKKYIDKIKKYFPVKKSFSQKTINPHKHWSIILMVFVILLICLIVFSLYLLFKIKNDTFLQEKPQQSNNQNKLNEELFNKVQKYFDYKSNEIESLKTTPLYIKDPSI